MRFVLFALLAAALAQPVAAQQLSPLTGTTSTPPMTTPPTTTPSTAAPPPAGSAAPGGRRMTLQQRFDAANTTHDGKLTLEQAKAGHMPQVARSFDAIDAGHKGYVTVADIVAYRQTARAARKAAKP